MEMSLRCDFAMYKPLLATAEQITIEQLNQTGYCCDWQFVDSLCYTFVLHQNLHLYECSSDYLSCLAYSLQTQGSWVWHNVNIIEEYSSNYSLYTVIIQMQRVLCVWEQMFQLMHNSPVIAFYCR